MSALPDPDFKPEDVDQVVKSYGKPVDPERKRALMATLEKERGRFARANNDRDAGNRQNRGKSR